MSAITLITVLVGSATAFLAPLHFWAFASPGLPRGSRWLGAAALGSAALAISFALLYESRSVEQAMWARRLIAVSFVPLYGGVLRFSEGYLDTRLRGNERVVFGLVACATLASFVPGGFFREQPVMRTMWLLPTPYVDVDVLPAGFALGVALVVPTVQLARAHYRYAASRGVGWGVGFAVVTLWSVCVLSDAAAYIGAFGMPFLVPIANCALVVSLTSIVLTRLVKALDSAEDEAALLQQWVDERAHELRDRDLQIAQGVNVAAAGTLAAGLAHELNNPLAFVAANLNQLEALQKDRSARGEFEEVLQETRDGIARMGGIVGQLDGIARGSTGQDQEVDLCAVVESVLPIVRQRAGNRVKLELELSHALVRGDANLLGQVILNLALNALHAARQSRSTPRVCVKTGVGEGRAWLSVDDNGPGIPDDVKPHIFDPFYTTKGSRDGTGLGLSLTRQIVLRHAGSIEVDSIPGRTRLRVSLPACPPGVDIPID